MTGKVYLVGAGPGAPDLLTLRAARLLAEADIIFHDALVPEPILALAAGAKKVAVGKRCGRHSTAQRFINKRLADAARTHTMVVRLKGGDPMIFARAQEEIAYLAAHGMPVEVVPGVTAALGASASLGTSLTQRGIARSVAFVTPRVGPEAPASRWLDAAMAADTVVIYMGTHDAPEIAAALMAAGKSADTPVAIADSATLPGERTAHGTLGNLAELVRGASTPLVILLGEVYRAKAVVPAKMGAQGISRAS
jgi:uroporphyrin-III C-methyltransferase